MHQVLIALLELNLTLSEARHLGFEETLCLLHHRKFDLQLASLESESARVASLGFADPDSQTRGLSSLAHRHAALVERFYLSG